MKPSAVKYTLCLFLFLHLPYADLWMSNGSYIPFGLGLGTVKAEKLVLTKKRYIATCHVAIESGSRNSSKKPAYPNMFHEPFCRQVFVSAIFRRLATALCPCSPPFGTHPVPGYW
ncbi:hypothetical protein ACQKWADRAFT_97425 [Trichoderma austrokoningii]